MINNAIIYTLQKLDVLEHNENFFSDNSFEPCLPSQATSSGWVQPRGEMYFETINGQHIMKLMTETKKVPAEVIERHLAERIKRLEQVTGRKPGKKERKEIKDEIVLDLLPTAFPSRQSTLVWIDPLNMTVVIDASNQKRADAVITHLVRTIPGIEIAMRVYESNPGATMAGWLDSQEEPDGFAIDRSCVLIAQDESAAKVKYVNHDLYIDEVSDHIQNGMRVQTLAMTWTDKVSFTLTDAANLKQIKFIDIAEDKDSFESSVALMTGSMQPLIVDLSLALK